MRIGTLLYSAIPLLPTAIGGNPRTIMIGVVIGFLILSLALHEYGHAWMAYRCGDDTAERMGRLTLNPLAHIDPVMTILLPAILFYTTGYAFGGAKPVPVSVNRLRHPARDMMLVALAGPAMNIFLALIFSVVWKVLVYQGIYDPSAILPRAMQYTMFLNLLLAAFNMIPIPPLDGSRVLSYFLPSGVRETYQSIERYGMIIIFAIIIYGGFGPLLGGVLDVMMDYVDLVTGGNWTT